MNSRTQTALHLQGSLRGEAVEARLIRNIGPFVNDIFANAPGAYVDNAILLSSKRKTAVGNDSVT